MFRDTQGLQQPKPVIMGSTADEGMIFLAEAFPDKMGDPLYNSLLTAVFKPEQARKIRERYPPVSC